MTIEFKENRYFIGVWMVADGKRDWMGAVYRDNDEPEGTWHLQYRFRYYETKDPWDGKDKKNWYSGTITGKPEADVERTTHEAAHFIKESWPFNDGDPMFDFVALHTDDPVECTKRFTERSWAHKKTFESAEAAQEFMDNMGKEP